jgi:transglutaminase-like putative cysteine protease
MSLSPEVHFYSLSMGDRAVGLATSRLDTVPEGYVLDDVLSLELPALGQTGTAVARTRVELDPALVMREFSFSMDSEVGQFTASGQVHGDSLLSVTVDAGGAEQELSFRLAESPVFAAILPIRLAMSGKLEVGERLRLPVFDPSTLSTRDVDVRVLAHDTIAVPDSVALDPETQRWVAATWDTVPAWHVSETFGGVRTESWIDDDGRILRASSPLGFSMERTQYELARQSRDDGKGRESAVDEDVILATAIQSDVDLGTVEAHDALSFVLGGVELDGFDLDGGRQRLRGDTLRVRREAWSELDPGYSLPYKRMDLKEALQPEPLIQSDDPRIIRRARRIAGRMKDPVATAQLLARWVHDALEKEITFSVPSAVQVLEAGRGDCNEHTVLYVALARSLGLPARTAVGLVYVNGGFFYHAWPEVWLGEWVAVDPTLGQHPADAAHLRFVVGGLAQQVDIVRLIGRLQIDVVEAAEVAMMTRGGAR